MDCVICFGLFRQNSKYGCVRCRFSDLNFVVNLGLLVQDGLSHISDKIWGVVPAKFKMDI